LKKIDADFINYSFMFYNLKRVCDRFKFRQLSNEATLGEQPLIVWIKVSFD